MSAKSRLSFALLLLFLLLSFLLLKQIQDLVDLGDFQVVDVSSHPQHDYIDLPITSDPIISLSHLAAMSPPVPPSISCSPPAPLPPPPSCEADRNTGLTGQRLKEPRTLVMMSMFGFEVDTMEIALREQLDYLDMIFIVESTINQKGVRSNFYRAFKYKKQ